MRAISDTVGVEEGAVRSLASGADAVCLGRDLGGEAVTATREALVGAVRTGRLPQERLAAAAARVDAAAAWAASARGAASEADVGAEVARRALHAQGDVESDRPALVVELVPDPSPAAGEASYGLGDALAALEPSTRVVRLSAPPAPTRLVEAERRLVIVVRDAHRHRWQREVAAALLAEAPDALVVETGVPVWRPAAGSGHVATHGAARVNVEAAAALLSSSRVPARR
jgi:beta-N-acetylhexosaminidase